MPESKSPLEQALDLFVYAPLGLALTAQEELPKLVEKGRLRVSGQVMMARMMGQFAVAQGQKEAEKAVKRLLTPPAPAAPGPAASAGSASAPSAPSSAPAPARASGPGPSRTVTAASTPSSAASTSNGGGVPPVDHLAIPGYDSLSASQVVQRLAGLSGAELAAVATYEAATRHRKTILTRVSQLQ